MKKCRYLVFVLTLWVEQAFAQNPIVRDQFTADPTARVFNDRVYVYPSHDILAAEGKGRPGWFCMEDYHVFSSTNLTDWTDHGMIVSQTTVPWAKPDGYSMWAPDCVERNGKYYFYFPTLASDTTYNGKGFSIGVAIADSPTGPFTPMATPIIGVKGIDPNVLIDKDGQAYLYWSQGHIYGAKLKENMVELDSEVRILQDLPDKGLKEGPFVFERNGLYYMTYPHVGNKTERLEYAVGDNPMGPFTFRGVIMDESPTRCWTNHHSIIPYQDQWYLFYHHNDYSPKFDKSRSIRVDSLSFDGEGNIVKVIPTLRGVGTTSAYGKIQLDRYSGLSESGASIDLLDSANTFKGWYVILKSPESWARYNQVDFGKSSPKSVTVRVRAPEGGEIRIETPKSGVAISWIKVPKTSEWIEVNAPLKNLIGVKNLVLVLADGQSTEIDWVSFKK